MDDSPRISVVIPCYRSEATIGRCLRALRAQVGAPVFEVVVVDSSPDGATAREVERANAPVPTSSPASRPPAEAPCGTPRIDDEGDPRGLPRPAPLALRLERSPVRLHPGQARNRGASLARSPWLLFLDSDCVPAADLVATAARLRDAGASVVGGSIALRADAPASAHVRHLLEFKENLPGVPARDTWQIPSACALVERSVFEAQGGYPETRASEDWLFDWSVWQAGHRMRFEPSLRVEHLTGAGWGDLARYLGVLGRASGAARRRGGLPGQALVRWPVLALGLPIVRTVRALAWCARFSPGDFRFLLLAWPAYLAMAGVWAAAFHRGVVDGDGPTPEVDDGLRPPPDAHRAGGP